MSFEKKKPEAVVIGGVLGDKLKKSTPAWSKQTNQKNMPSSVSKGKSTKAFNRKRAGR